MSSRAYCVDGTNVVRGLFGYAGEAFRAQEDSDGERLVSALAQLCEGLPTRLEIDLFFDGPERAFPGMRRLPNLHIRFARELEADDLILDRVRAEIHVRRTVTVVTADGELGRMAAEEGAGWLKVRPRSSLESLIRGIEAKFRR